MMLHVLQVVAVMWTVVSAQPPSFGNPPSFGGIPQTAGTTSSTGSCNYLLSMGQTGNCILTTVDVEKKIDAVKAEISRDRLQHVTHNSVVQKELAELEDKDKQLILKVDGLQRDLMSLSSRLQSQGQGSIIIGTGGGSLNLKQVRDSLLMDIRALDSRVSNLTYVRQRDAVNQAKVDAALQLQLTQLVQVLV